MMIAIPIRVRWPGGRGRDTHCGKPLAGRLKKTLCQCIVAMFAGTIFSLARRGSEGGPVTLPVFKTGDWHLRCQWCVRLAHASASYRKLLPRTAIILDRELPRPSKTSLNGAPMLNRLLQQKLWLGHPAQIRKEIARLQSKTARRKVIPIQDESERLKIIQEAHRDGMQSGELCELYLSLLPEREEAERFWTELDTSLTPRGESIESASMPFRSVADAANIDALAARAREFAARREVARTTQRIMMT